MTPERLKALTARNAELYAKAHIKGTKVGALILIKLEGQAINYELELAVEERKNTDGA